MTGTFLAIGPCFVCGEPFSFDPDTVDSVPIDPVTQLPPDLGGRQERAVKRPICTRCMKLVEERRAQLRRDAE